MEKYVHIKDALIQYRYMSQSANISSLETVLLYYKDEVERIFKENSINGENSKVI